MLKTSANIMANFVLSIQINPGKIFLKIETTQINKKNNLKKYYFLVRIRQRKRMILWSNIVN
jgi:hypothetical protein